MIRLHVTAEGQTELSFVKRVLAPHLAPLKVFADGRCVLTRKHKKIHREYRGGLKTYEKVRKDITTWMKEDSNPECRFTTMFDLHGLPDNFPGFHKVSQRTDPYEKVTTLESALRQDINDYRFIPYIQLHEFETLILADPARLDWEYLEHECQISNLIAMVGRQNPELIDDGPESSPSKRILKEIPEYNKVTAGVSVVAKVGMATLLKKCRHFAEWLKKLEQLAGDAP